MASLKYMRYPVSRIQEFKEIWPIMILGLSYLSVVSMSMNHGRLNVRLKVDDSKLNIHI